MRGDGTAGGRAQFCARPQPAQDRPRQKIAPRERAVPRNHPLRQLAAQVGCLARLNG